MARRDAATSSMRRVRTPRSYCVAMGRNAALCWRTGACCSGLGVGATGDAAACMPCLHAAAIEPTLISLLLIHNEYVIQENVHMLCHSIALFVVCFYASAPGMRAGTPPCALPLLLPVALHSMGTTASFEH